MKLECLRKCVDMEKVFDVMLAVLLAFLLAKTIPVLACSKGGEIVTGAACSIQELNSAAENKIFVDNLHSENKTYRNLRPVKIVEPEKNNYGKVDCLFGNCLYKTILKIY